MDTKARGGDTLRMILAMFLFGTLGVFVRNIPLSSAAIALVRAVLGLAFLALFMLLRGKKLSLRAVRANLPLLCISGACLGINWILLFEAYRFTTVAAATLCYYMAPVILVLVSPRLFGEKLNARKIVCVALTVIGMIPVSGVLRTGVGAGELRGVALGLCAAVFYAAVVSLNKFLRDLSAYERTFSQLAICSLVLLPYVLLTGGFEPVGGSFTLTAILCTLAVGVVHTGLCYTLYFGSLETLKAQTTAILSYIDPVTAVLLSAFLLRETPDAAVIVGAVLILGSAMLSELPQK